MAPIERRDWSQRVHGQPLHGAGWHHGAGWQPGRPVLVLLHEALGAVSLWRGFPGDLAQATGLDVFAWDRLGHGRSAPLPGPRPPDYHHREALDWLPAVLQAAGIERPLPVGHSDGATIALLHGAHHPVPGVIAMAAHAFVEPETLAGIRAAERVYAAGELPARLARHHGEKTDALFRAWVDTWCDPGFAHWNIEAELAGLRAPLLLLQGEDDDYATPAQLTRIAAATSGPAATRLLPDCGHQPQREAPAATLEAITGFLDAHALR